MEDIEAGQFLLSESLGIPVLPAFIEQAVEGEENRFVFGKPFLVPKGCRSFDGYRESLLEGIIAAQNELPTLTGTPAREVALDPEHQVRKKIKQANQVLS